MVIDKEAYVTLADFEDALVMLRETKTPYSLVGGLAIGVWSEELLTPSEKKDFELPIRSKDIDMRSGKDAAVILALELRHQGAIVSHGATRIAKDPNQSFPCFVTVIKLPPKPNEKERIETTVEALAGMPLLDTYQDESKTKIQHHGTTLQAHGIYLLDPCSLMVCKLNAIHTRPAAESENDLKHTKILSLVIPRFIQRALERHRDHQDPYHPKTDAQRLAHFLTQQPWEDLIPNHERQIILEACELAVKSENQNHSTTPNQPGED